jgi:hypothetical protein
MEMPFRHVRLVSCGDLPEANYRTQCKSATPKKSEIQALFECPYLSR